jgi:hypothetical protein
MTEAEWLTCTEPTLMTEYVRLNHLASERKLRLLSIECGRRFLHLLGDERSRRAVEIAEGFVEGIVTHKERAKAAADAVDAASEARSQRKTGAAIAAAVAAARMVGSDWPLFAQRFGPSGKAGQEYAWHAVRDSVFFTGKKDQCMLWCELVGNPFRPAAVASSCFAWNDGAVRKMAQAIYDDRAFDRLPLLADALEEAGCNNQDILDHCRSAGEHVRGCWVVDLILCKS